MTYIKKISMSGFKSFGDRTVTVKLSSGFTCIVGPNGAGKSNIIDALCFALGRLSKKTMRAKSLEDLIFAGSKGRNPSNRASVTLYFDNSEGIFPGSSDSFSITRTIKRGGGGGYKMNDAKATRQQILNALATANIDPDGSNQFVLQGKIVELTHMNSVDRRKFIEELIGLQKYDEMKDATLKELDKAERDLGQFEAIFKEVSSQLKKVEKEKNDALAWRELNDQINHYNAQLIALKITKLQAEEEELDNKIENSSKIIEEFEEKITRQEEVLKQETFIMESIQKTVSEKEKEKEGIVEEITQFKTQLSSNQTSLNLARKSIEKFTTDKQKLENILMTIEEGQTFDSLMEDTTEKINENETQIEQAKKEIEKTQQNQADLDIKIKKDEDINSGLKAEISDIKQKISSNKAQIKILKTNIKNNEAKKKNLEMELNKLKGDAESVDEAIEDTKKLENQIRKKIEELKSKISEENQKQKELETTISSVQEEKNQLNLKITDLKSSLSSLNTEIKMNNESIEELNLKRSKTEENIMELSKGKDTEEVLKEFLNERKELSQDLNDLKDKSKLNNENFKKNEQKLELLKMKKNSFETEIHDNKAKISNINIELKMGKKELTNLEREKNNLDLDIKTLNSNISKTDEDIENSNHKIENIKRRLQNLSEEREVLLEKIENTEHEYNKNKEDITGILQILNMLTQNINISVETIKGTIQQSNSEAIEMSAADFRKFILDLIDIMKTIEGVKHHSDETSEVDDMENSIHQTLTLLTSNTDSTINQLINKVKESADVAVQESTSNFDSFVQDLIEILENVHLSLRKLTMSKSQELYQQLEEFSESIKSQENDFNIIERNLTEMILQRRHDDEKLTISNQRIEYVNKRILELNERSESSEKEIINRDNTIKEKQKLSEEIELEIKILNDLKEKFWEDSSKIQDEIEKKQKELDNIQGKLQDLQGLQTLFKNIEEIDADIINLNKIVEQKKTLIVNTEEGINKLLSDQITLQNNIEILKGKREEFWGITENIRKQIDDENLKLEETMDNLRALQNVMRIITSIEELGKEDLEAMESIENSNKSIETFNSQVDETQKNVDDNQKIIESLRDDKSKELDAQKVAQQNLNQLNKELQKTQGILNEILKNKEREKQIIALGEEIKFNEKQIDSISENIEKIEENLSNESKKKEEKQVEIDKFVKEKDESWNKQKQYQKTLMDLKSDLSMENSKMNNFESKKIIWTDQIETLFQRSKDYGTLPPVSDELSEDGLQSDIQVANNKKKALEPVNLKAIQQYDTVKERFDEIDMRRQTIQRERKAILDNIEKIDLEKTRTFMKAYHEINREFSRIFQKLSPGGSAKMMLDRPDKPFEGGISIEARPRGKRISSLEILSGGEKTLVALSFIFAVQEFYPAPFYVMDEIDAALDGPNVHRVSTVIKEFASQAQFMVISHREENIVNSDRIYGVSMPQSGITDIFSVNLEEEAKRILELEDAVSEVE